MLRFGDAEIGEQKRRGLGAHGTTTVGMQGQLAKRHGMLGDGIAEQCREQGRAFSVGDAPADNSSAENVDDDVDVTGCLNPRVDGAACVGEDKGAVEAPELFNGMAIQSDGLSVASSV